MKVTIKKLALIGLSIIMCLSLSNCKKSVIPDPIPGPVEPTNARPYLHGIGEPLFNSVVSGFNADKAIDLIEAIGAKSYRSWLEPELFENIYFDSSAEKLRVLNDGLVEYYASIFSKLKKQGVDQIIGHLIIFPRVKSTVGYKIYSVPRRDTTPNSEYMQFLERSEVIFEVLAKTFPQIEVWEVSNESNASQFMHPKEYENNKNIVFTQEESAAIMTDYMYYCSKGIAKGNPKAIAINPGWSPYLGPVEGLEDVKEFFKLIYKNIKSNEFPAGDVKSSNSGDYFKGLSWHPYYGHTTAPDEKWKQLNDDIFKVAQDNGDGDLKVYFTEIGFSSGYGVSASQEEQSKWYDIIFEMVDRMPYVESVSMFRLFESSGDANWGGPGEKFFGMFCEPSGDKGFVPNAKAFALQKIYGGTGNLSMHA